MKAKYDGICEVCQEKITAGQDEIIRYEDATHSKEWIHETCASVDAIVSQANILYNAILKIVPDRKRFRKKAADDLDHIKDTPSFMLLARMRRLLEDASDFAERH